MVELYARGVRSSELMGFVEISELIFDHQNDLLIDPSAEKIKAEFGDVNNTYLPLHSIIRIDEVEKTGLNKIRPLTKHDRTTGNVATFPHSTESKN